MSDQAAELFVRFFAQGKFYTLFSILFGLGLAIQAERAEARGVRYGRLFARRLSWLFVIGMVHAWLIWMGDILVGYALAGFLLIPFRKRRYRTLAIWTVVLLLIPLLVFAVPVFLVDIPEQDEAEIVLAIDSATEAYSSGDFGWIMGQRALDVLTIWAFTFVSFPNFLALFLIGLTLGRRRFFQNIEDNLPFVRRWIWWLLAVGLVGNTIMVVAMELSPQPMSRIGWFVQLAGTFGAPALTLFYMSSLTLLAQRERWRRWLTPIAAVGRMALTNYLLQSVCLLGSVALLTELGAPAIRPLAGIALTVIVYTAQVAASRWWLVRYRFGPVEWAWRSLSYGRRQPFRA